MILTKIMVCWRPKYLSSLCKLYIWMLNPPLAKNDIKYWAFHMQILK